MQGFTKFDLVVLVVYLGAVLYAGLKFSKKEMKGKEFFRGDGTIPWWVTSVSIFATLLSPISFLSLAGNSYKGTWIMWFAQLGMFVAVPLTIRYFLPVYSRLDIDTAYEYLEIRYKDKGLRILGAIMFIIYQIGRMAIIMYLPSMVLANLTGINVYLLIVAMGVIAIIYSYTGGLKSVLWTDFIQGCVLIAGIVFSLIFLISTINGGFGAIMSELTEGGKFLSSQEPIFNANIFKTSVFLLIVGGGLNTFSSYISSQDIVQRFTTTTDIKQLKKMTYGNLVLSLFVATVFYLIGTALYVFYNQNPQLLQTARPNFCIIYSIPITSWYNRYSFSRYICSSSINTFNWIKLSCNKLDFRYPKLYNKRYVNGKANKSCSIYIIRCWYSFNNYGSNPCKWWSKLSLRMV